MSAEEDPEIWDSAQVALSEAQLSNKQDAQWQQLEVMRQRLERQQAEQRRLHTEELEKLQQLQEGLTKQHAEQQQTITTAISASGGRECFNDDGNCNAGPPSWPACLSNEV